MKILCATDLLSNSDSAIYLLGRSRIASARSCRCCT